MKAFVNRHWSVNCEFPRANKEEEKVSPVCEERSCINLHSLKT